MKNKKTLYLVHAAVIAAIYVILVISFEPLSFGPVQFRVAEGLTVLPFFTLAAVPGLFIGCMIANLIGGAIPADIIFGSLATLAGAYFSYRLRKYKWLVPVPPIVANMLVVPFVLKYGYGVPDAIPYMIVTVGIGEILGCGLIGMTLLIALNRYKGKIFPANYIYK